MSYVVRSFPNCGCWTVGFYQADDGWIAEGDHKTPEAAGNRCSFLNGNPQPDLLELERLRIFAGIKRQCENQGMHVEGVIGPDVIALEFRLCQTHPLVVAMTQAISALDPMGRDELKDAIAKASTPS
ncbi:MAG: hypothetical protein ACREJD_09535 [Phycisphaerales bacterium]